MNERQKKLLRYVELAASETRGGCGEKCKQEMECILRELGLTHEAAVHEGKSLIGNNV